MKLNNSRKWILIIYALIIGLMCIIYVPNKIIARDTNGHSYILKNTYYPIWYDYKDKGNGKEGIIVSNSIDYSKLSTQIFSVTILLGVAFIISNKENNM